MIPSLSTEKGRMPTDTLWPLEMGRFQCFPPPCLVPQLKMWPSHCIISRRGHSQALQVLPFTAWHELNPRCTVQAWVLSCELTFPFAKFTAGSTSCLNPYLRAGPHPCHQGCCFPQFILFPPHSPVQWPVSIFKPEGLGDSSSLERCLQIPLIPFSSSAPSMMASQ